MDKKQEELAKLTANLIETLAKIVFATYKASGESKETVVESYCDLLRKGVDSLE